MAPQSAKQTAATALNVVGTQDDRVGIKQFRADGCLSYIYWDRGAREAALIDPHPELLDDYRSYLMERGLKLVWALDTHTHADHRSVSHLLKQEYGAGIAMSEASESQRPSRRLRDGDVVGVGRLSLKVLATPGHTPDSICYLGEGQVFTGDTLLIGSSGRTDFPGSDPDQQWKSIRGVLGNLPDGTVVWPGHDYNDHLFSTIETEKSKNSHLLMPSMEAFSAMKRAEVISGLKDEVRKIIQFNRDAAPELSMAELSSGPKLACGAASAQTGNFNTVSIDKFAQRLNESGPAGIQFVDVREEDEFKEGHIPKTRNIPLSELGQHLPELQKASRIYVSCLAGKRSMLAAKTLTYLGFADVVNVAGGFQAWKQAGYPVEK